MSIKHFARKVSGQGRILYSHPDQMGVVPVGLPEGIDFKQPSLYKAKELRRVYDSLDKFQFIFTNDEVQATTSSVDVNSDQQEPVVMDNSSATG